jgi:hypothetical protein
MTEHIHVHVHLHPDDDTARKLDRILAAVSTLTTAVHQEEIALSQELEALKAQVAENTAVEQSAVTLISGLAGQIAALKDDPAALQALSDSLHSSADSLAAAIAANTPAAPPQ